MKKIILSLVLVSFLGCTSTMTEGLSGTSNNVGKNAGAGALGGAALGALAGQLIGGDTKATLIGAAIGAGVGAGAGAGWGAYKNKQEQELRAKLANSGVTIVSAGNELKLILPGDLSFPTGSYNLSPSFFGPLSSIAAVLKQYPESKINIVGYTDSVGTYDKNMLLSQNRATAVAQYFNSNGIAGSRIAYTGYGPTNFIGDNATAQGRAMNRRVEISILPNDTK